MKKQIVLAISLAVLGMTAPQVVVAGPHGTIQVRPIDDGFLTIDGDFSDWPLENFQVVVEQPPAPQGLEADSVDSVGDHIVFELERSGFFNGTETAELTKAGLGDFGVATYFAYDSEAFYILSVYIDEMVRDDRDTTETGSSGFLNDGFEFLLDANGDSSDCAAGLMFPAFDNEEPNLDDLQITVAVNENFLPDNASPDQLGARQGVERGGNPDIVGPEKNGPGGLLRDALDALDGPDIAARAYADLRAAGARNPEILANAGETFAGYVIEQKIPFGFIPEFTPDHAMKYTQFWRDFDDEADAGGANQSWIDWTQNSNVGCADDGSVDGLFHTGTWAALEFVLDPPLFAKDAQNITVSRRANFGQVDLPPLVRDFAIPIGNVGNVGTLAIESITVSGRDAAHFSVSGPSTLGPKEFAEITVTFDSMGVTGAYEAVIEVKSDDEDVADRTRTVEIFVSASDPAGPFAHLRLDETEGLDLVDSSGNGRGGVVSDAAGAVVLNEDPLAAGRSLRVADGGSVRIDSASFEALNSFSLSLWFRADSAAGQGTLVSKGASGSPVFAILQAGKNAAFFVNEGAIFTTEGDLIGDVTPHHLAVVYDNTEGARRASIFLDGAEAGFLDDPVALDDFPDEPFWLGSFAGSLGFNGGIDDFQFYDRVLSAEEVAGLFGNPGDPIRGVEPVDGGGGGGGDLVAHWTFEGDAQDQAGANHGTLENGAAFATSFDGSQALSLDGVDDYVSTTDLDLDFISIAAWVNALGDENQAYVVNKNYDGSAVPYSLNVGGNNSAEALDGLGWFTAGWKNSGLGANGDLRGAGWHHVAGTYDGATLKYFVDGDLVASTEEGSGPLPQNDNVLDIGRYLNDEDYFGGLIDNLRIYKVALPDAAIKALYEDEKPASALLVDLDATGLAPGAVSEWSNAGDLGGVFLATGDPTVEAVKGVNGITLDGDDTLQGPNATAALEGNGNPRSVEAWIYNPAPLVAEEAIIAWGHRGGPDGANFGFHSGNHPDFGAVGHWGAADLGWNEAHVGDAWQYLVSTLDANQQHKVYVDGELVNEEDLSGFDLVTHPGQPITVGAENAEAGGAVKAVFASLTVGKVRVHAATLSGDQIASTYASEKAAFADPDDVDGDRLSDALERELFGDLSQGPDDDFDGDGLSNADEIRSGSDPTMAEAVTVLVELDASSLAEGPIASWPNAGGLGGEFQAFGDPLVEVIEGVVGVSLDGDGDYFEGPASTPAIEGASARSIIAWVYNPELQSEETVISWGKRGGPDGTNLAFNHGFHNVFGAVGHWGSPDIGWNPNTDVEEEDPGVLGDAKQGEWTHLVYTQTGSLTRVYTNGQLTNSESVNINTHPGLGILIGAQREGDGVAVTEPLKGSLSIANVRVYDGVIADADILADFQAGIPAAVSPNLVGYWPADDGAGTTVTDASGNGLDGTLRDGAWVAGTSGGAFQLTGADGGGSHVEVPPTGKTFSSITVAAWVNGVQTGAWSGLVQARGGAAPDQPIGIGYRDASGELAYTWNDNDGNSWGFESGLAIPPNEWTFVALSVTADAAKLYVGSGGELQSATNAIPQIPQINENTAWFFGKDNCCGTARNFAGAMDDIAIWDVALSDAELLALFNGTETPLSLQPAGGPGPGPTTAYDLLDVGVNANGAFSVTIPDGVTADVEYSTDLINWEVIATGLTGTVEETDAARQAAPSGYYRAR